MKAVTPYGSLPLTRGGGGGGGRGEGDINQRNNTPTFTMRCEKGPIVKMEGDYIYTHKRTNKQTH